MWSKTAMPSSPGTSVCNKSWLTSSRSTASRSTSSIMRTLEAQLPPGIRAPVCALQLPAVPSVGAARVMSSYPAVAIVEISHLGDEEAAQRDEELAQLQADIE